MFRSPGFFFFFFGLSHKKKKSPKPPKKCPKMPNNVLGANAGRGKTTAAIMWSVAVQKWGSLCRAWVAGARGATSVAASCAVACSAKRRVSCWTPTKTTNTSEIPLSMPHVRNPDFVPVDTIATRVERSKRLNVYWLIGIVAGLKTLSQNRPYINQHRQYVWGSTCLLCNNTLLSPCSILRSRNLRNRSLEIVQTPGTNHPSRLAWQGIPQRQHMCHFPCSIF